MTQTAQTERASWELSLFVPGDCIAQPKPHARAIAGHAQIYTPRNGGIGEWRRRVFDLALAARGDRPSLDGPVSVAFTFAMRRPKKHFQKSGDLRPSAPYWHTGRPDSDNLAKAVLDSLSESSYWHDDAQVCDLRVQKRYAGLREQPGCYVRVTGQGGKGDGDGD